MKEIAAAGGYTTVKTLGSGFSRPYGVAVDGSGNVFVADYGHSAVQEIAAAGGYTIVKTLGSGFSVPLGVAVDGSGNVFVADIGNNAVEKITTQIRDFGSVAVGASSAVLSLSFAFDTAGTIGAPLVLTQGAPGLDFGSQIGGTCVAGHAFAAGASCTVNVGFAPRANGIRYGGVALTDGAGNVLATAYVQGTGLGPQLSFSPPAASVIANLGAANSNMAVDGHGNIIFSDTAGNAVKELVASNGYSPVNIGPGCSCPEGAAVDGYGNIFVASAQDGPVTEFVPAPGGYAARTLVGGGFSNPQGVAVDASGNIFVADTGNDAVKKILAAGGYTAVQTVGSGFSSPQSVAVDASGNVFVADTGNQAVKEVLAVSGYTTVQSIGGGFGSPTGVAVDGYGDVLVADQANGAVMEIAAAGGYTVVNTVVSVPEALRVAVDQTGSIFVLSAADGQLTKFDYAHPAALHFAATAPGSTSSDSPQVVTLANSGNSPLTFEVPSSGQNPSLAAGFTFGTDSTCPVLAAGASPATLAPGETCTASIRFTPTSVGAVGGSLAVVDNALNAAAPSYVTQSIALTGTGAASSVPMITFAVPSHTYGDTPFAVAASSDSTGAFTYSVISGPATIAGATVTLTGAGTVVLQAAEAADPTHAAATRTTIFSVNGEVPTLNFTPIPAQTYGAVPFQVNAASASSGAVTYMVISGPAMIAGSTVTLTGAGTVTLGASQAASGNYQAATATTSFSVSGGASTLSFTPIPMQTYGTAPFQVHAGSASSGAVTYTVLSGPATIAGSTVTLTGAGTVTLGASQAAGGGYQAATATTSFTVTPAVPALSFISIPAQTYGAAPFQVNATSASNGAVVYTVVSGPATIAGSTVTLTGAGTVTLGASQAVSGNYQAATATTSFAVSAGFALTADNTAVSAAPGAPALFNLNFAPAGTTIYSDAVTLTVAGLPSGATATFSPASIPAGSAVVPVTLIIQTAGGQTARAGGFPNKPFGRIAIGLLLPLFGAGAARKRLRRLPVLLAVAGLSLGALGLIGCGGGGRGGFSQPAASHTSATYAVAVIARDSVTGLQNTTNLALTMQ